MHKFKNIIFDFGGVFYNIDRTKTKEAFIELSKDKNAAKSINLKDLVFLPEFMLYERGKISTTEFCEFIRSFLNTDASDQLISKAWNATLIDLFPFAFEYIKAFREKVPNIVMLCNTNQLHYDFFYPQTVDFLPHFDKCFFSHQIGMAKPNTDIFQYVLESSGFLPADTLFVDDTIENIKAAEELGISVFHINTQNKLSDLLHTM